jgi:predicted enzyme related to lactoylglutathione lyase
MRIHLNSVFVDDQKVALAFYTDVLGFEKKHDIPLAQFAVDDVEAEHQRLTARGVVFTQPPTDVGTAVMAVFDDTCGNLIQILAEK